ncbi:CEP192 [Branchiostoma lanceolatum]|uniref:CEP192 protein n=1 Tax=Branchiostoma lanceolatum TaxID=7740 RepID=A0A8S4MMK5_BRALA|nr:CEP192 [Branchiostoma lanceolatum]
MRWGKYYVQLPVYFKPTQPGKYESMLVIQSDLKGSFAVQLVGEATSPHGTSLVGSCKARVKFSVARKVSGGHLLVKKKNGFQENS